MVATSAKTHLIIVHQRLECYELYGYCNPQNLTVILCLNK